MKSWSAGLSLFLLALTIGACDTLGDRSEKPHDEALYPTRVVTRFQAGPDFVLERSPVRSFFPHMALAPRPDGAFLVTGAPGSPATLWHYTRDGELIEEIAPPPLCQDEPCNVSTTQQGLVFTRFHDDDDVNRVVSTDLGGQTVATFALPPATFALPDGSLITVRDGTLTRYNADGTLRWTQPDLPLRYRAVAPDSEGGLLVAGWIPDGKNATLDREEVVLLRLGAQGNILWTKNFDDCLSCNVLQVRALDDGAFFLYGRMTVTDDGHNFSSRPWMVVLGDDGTVLGDSEAWPEPLSRLSVERRLPAWAALEVVTGTREAVEVVVNQSRTNRPPRTLRIDPDQGIAADYEWPIRLSPQDGLCHARDIIRTDAGQMALLLDCQDVEAFSGIGSGRYWLDVLTTR